MPYLDEQSFRRTFSERMQRLGPEDAPPFDFWPYVEAIPTEDYADHDCSDARVEWVWRTSDGKYEHVLIDTKEDKDVFMVVVLDVESKAVIGHRLLDLKSEYGLRSSSR